MASSDGHPRPALLRLADGDNVAVAATPLAPGRAAVLDGVALVVRERIDVGHKVAVRAVAAGEKIVKWGFPIGSATRDIAAGEHVHTHNLESDYLPTFTLDAGEKFVEGH